MTNTCQVLQLADYRKPASRVHRIPQSSQTPTALNGQARHQRGESWDAANILRLYWRARLDMESAISCVQRRQLPVGSNHPVTTPENRFETVENWRVAIAWQILTPAPTVAAVLWKRSALKSRQFKHVPLSRERAEQAIADDLAFLAAHPVRQSKREA